MSVRAASDYKECRDHILGFYKDQHALLKKVGNEVDDAYDYLQDFLRQGLKPNATDGLFWAAFALALHIIPGGAAYANLTKTLTVIKDAQPVFAKAQAMRSQTAIPRGESNKPRIEDQKEQLEARLAKLEGLVEVADVGKSKRHGDEVNKALAYLDRLDQQLQRSRRCAPLLSRVKSDIGPRFSPGWQTRLNDLGLDHKIAEMFIVNYVRDTARAEKYTWSVDFWIEGLNDHQEKYIYDRKDVFRSKVSNANEMKERWGLAWKTSGERGISWGDPKTQRIPFEKWPGF